MNKRIVIYTRASTTNQEENFFLSLQLASDCQGRLVKPADVEVLRRPVPATPVAQSERDRTNE